VCAAAVCAVEDDTSPGAKPARQRTAAGGTPLPAGYTLAGLTERQRRLWEADKVRMYQLSQLLRRNINALVCQAYLRHQSVPLRLSMHTQQMLSTSVWRACHHGQVCTAHSSMQG
jgi:hypothetical protein